MDSEAQEIQVFLEALSLRVVSPKQPDGKLYDVKEEVLDQMKARPYAIEYFFGQTILYLQKELFEKIGPEKLMQLIRRVYGESLYDFGFSGTVGEFTQSYSLDLP